MIEHLLHNNKGICKELEELSNFAMKTIEKLSKRPTDE